MKNENLHIVVRKKCQQSRRRRAGKGSVEQVVSFTLILCFARSQELNPGSHRRGTFFFSKKEANL